MIGARSKNLRRMARAAFGELRVGAVEIDTQRFVASTERLGDRLAGLADSQPLKSLAQRRHGIPQVALAIVELGPHHRALVVDVDHGLADPADAVGAIGQGSEHCLTGGEVFRRRRQSRDRCADAAGDKGDRRR